MSELFIPLFDGTVLFKFHNLSVSSSEPVINSGSVA
jgi:hypothetical protein